MKTIKLKRNPSGGELTSQGAFQWPSWTKEISEFPWHYGEQETCYVLERDFVVTPDGGKPVKIVKGDLVTFPEGMSCPWKIKAAMRKHYKSGK